VSTLRTVALTAAALCCFAGNSLLCRLALAPKAIDPATFTSVRMLSGALALTLLVRTTLPRGERKGGGWLAALVLVLYAVPFSFAYTRLGAGQGALLLFGTVQLTMIGWGFVTGERPRLLEWVGLAVALSGLVALTYPGLSAPDPAGAALMVVAGVAWGAYSIHGRSAGGQPPSANARNFVRALPFAALVSLVALPERNASPRGLLLAAASGALASGVGYSFWYSALESLTATRAAIVQLSVPVIAALGGVVLLGESLTPRLAATGAAILCGVALALLGRRTS